MPKNNNMVFNSIGIVRRQDFKEISLSVGCGGTSNVLSSKSFKSSVLRITKEHDSHIWNDNPELNDVDELFMPIYEDELCDAELGQCLQVAIDLNKYWRIGKHDFIQKIVRHFRGMGFPVSRDFIGRVEIWVPTEEESSILYNRYTLCPRYHDVTDGWQIDVSHSGETRVSKKNLMDVELDSYGYDVVAGTEVVPRNKLRQHHFEKYSGGHPVFNKYTARVLGGKMPYKFDRNKYATKRSLIIQFIKTYMMPEAFQNALDIDIINDGALIAVNSSNIMKVDDKARVLTYGGQNVGIRPRTEFNKYGPYIQPDEYTYFFISLNSEKSNNARIRLYNIFKNGLNSANLKLDDTDYEPQSKYKPLAKFLNQMPQWVPKLSLAYRSHDTAIQELDEHLKGASRFDPNKKYIAIIISEISKDDTDTNLHELYYRMKERLMKSNITSQVIYAPNVDDAKFSYFLPNIAAALVGKQNGMAWGLNSISSRNDMIVGIGASRQKDKKTYLGTAFCFDKEGKFREFDCCQANDTEALGASLKKALLQFCYTYGKPDRLIIHYYKKLRNDEGRRIERMLKETDVQCPVFVVNMVTAVNEDLIAFDTSEADYMPESGTYVCIRNKEYLLYNNERYADGEKSDILFPIKLSITSANTSTPGMLQPEDEADIIAQVYQFCRLYWKSVKMQNVPITIAYPKLLAEFVPHFADEELPSFGKSNLWML